MNPIHLVAGGSGYFGAVLVDHLVRAGRTVRVFDLIDAPDRPPQAEFIRGDIRDPQALRQAVAGAAAVFNCVAMVPLARDVKAFWSVNRDGAGHLLQACLEQKVEKVVHLSSSAVFGVPARNPVDDSVEPTPREEYGRAKLAAEALCRDYAGRGLDVTVIRPRTIMGPGRLGIMQIIFEWVRQGSNLPVLGRGDNLYQFVHADDLAGACLKAAAKKGPAVFNVGAADFRSMRETLQGLIDHGGTASRIVSLPRVPATIAMMAAGGLGLMPLGPYHHLMYGRSMYFDLTRVRAELDWEPRHGNVAMFRQSYDWWIQNRDRVLASSGASHHRSPVDQGVLKWVSRALNLI